MSATISLTESQVLTALRSFLQSILPPVDAASFTGAIDGNILTVSAVASGTIAIGQIITGPGVATGTFISSGSGNAWIVSQYQSVPSASLNSGVPIAVVKGQENRVPEPTNPNYVLMTPILRTRLETTTDIFTDTPEPTGNPSGTRASTAPTELTVQLDFHGPCSGDYSEIFITLWRDEFAIMSFVQAGIAARPLYAHEPRQLPFINAESQYEYRWSVDAAIQVNATITVPQAFAGTLGPVTLKQLT